MPLSVGSSNNLWAPLAEGSATARLASGARPKRSAHRSPAPQPRHLQAGGRPPHPFPAKRLLPPLRQPGSGQARQPASPEATRGRAAPHSSSRPEETGRRPAVAVAAAAASCVPSPPQRTPSGRPESFAGFVCAAARGVRGMRPGPRGRGQPGQPPLPTARRRPPSGAPRLRGSVAACARVGEAAPYLSLRSRGASSRAASASPPPLLRSHRASSCSRRRDRRAEPAAAACAGPRSASRPRPTPPGCSAPGPPTGGGEPEATQPGVASGTATCDPLSRGWDASATYPPGKGASPAPPRPAKPTRSSGTVRAPRPPQFTQALPPFRKEGRKGPSCPGLSLLL